MLLERQVQVMEAMAKAMGADVPEAFNAATEAASRYDESTRGSDPWMSHVNGIQAMAESMMTFAGDIDAARFRARSLADEIRKIPEPPNVPASAGGGGGNAGGNAPPKAQHGFIAAPRAGGTTIVTGERETELTAPVRGMISQMSAEISAALTNAGGGESGRPIIVNVQLGTKINKYMEEQFKNGTIRVHPSAVRSY